MKLWQLAILCQLLLGCERPLSVDGERNKTHPHPTVMEEGNANASESIQESSANKLSPSEIERGLLDQIRFGKVTSIEELERFVSQILNANLVENTTFIGNLSDLSVAHLNLSELSNLVSLWPIGRGQDILAVSLCPALAEQKGFEVADVWRLSLPDEKQRAGGAKALVKWNIEKDLPGTLQWAEALPSEIEKGAAFLAIQTFVSNNLAAGTRAALDEALNLVTDEALANRLYGLGADFLANQDLKTAQEWALQINENRPLSVDSILLKKCQFEEGVQYLDKLYEIHQTTRADAAFLKFVEFKCDQNPQSVLEWISTLSPEFPRHKAIGQAILAWKKNDEEAARKWAQNFADAEVKKSALDWLH